MLVDNISLLLLFPMGGLLAFVPDADRLPLSEPLSESTPILSPCPFAFPSPCCCCFFKEGGGDCCDCGFVVVEALFNFTTTAVMLSVLPSCSAACTRACAYSSADKSCCDCGCSCGCCYGLID